MFIPGNTGLQVVVAIAGVVVDAAILALVGHQIGKRVPKHDVHLTFDFTNNGVVVTGTQVAVTNNDPVVRA